MYKDPKRYAFIFQSYVQLTMLQLHTYKTQLPYKVMERSVYSSRLFIENMKCNKVLQDVEIVVLEEWYDWCIKSANIETDLISKFGIKLFYIEIIRMCFNLFFIYYFY